MTWFHFFYPCFSFFDSQTRANFIVQPFRSHQYLFVVLNGKLQYFLLLLNAQSLFRSQNTVLYN